MNVSRVWAHEPAIHDAIGDLIGQAASAGSLTYRQRGILISALASAMGDSYCSLAWGKRLAGEAGDDVAAGVLRGDDAALDPAERVLARWARQVSRDPNSTTPADVQALRDAGFDDAQIFAITCFISLRIAFSTVNDALGARPDHELNESAPAPVRDAIDFGRPVAPAPGPGEPT
jgi:alkylhydroperoxidase family enzyme